MNIAGILFSATSSESRQASLIIEGQKLFLSIAGEPLRIEVRVFRIHRRLGQLPRILELDGMRFETTDFDQVENFEKQLQEDSWIYRLESNTKAVVATTCGFIAALLLIYFVGIPAFSETLAPRVPAKVKDLISESTEKFLEGLHVDPNQVLDDKERRRFLDSTAKLREMYPDTEFSIYLIDMSGPNAFIIPNGTIYMTEGLVKLSESSDELLGVFLHEVGHWHHHHVMQRVIESSAISLMIIAITGGTEWTNVPLLLLTNQYSQNSELEADMYALTRMKRENLDKKSLQTMFEKFDNYGKEKKAGELPSFLSTHPSFQERIDQIQKFE